MSSPHALRPGNGPQVSCGPDEAIALRAPRPKRSYIPVCAGGVTRRDPDTRTTRY
jgi:hypothetical protein